MRMWMISPELMCQQHIRGEHFELHCHKHNFEKHHSIAGRVSPVVLIEPESMKTRHDELAKYLKNHQSPYELPDLSYLPKEQRMAKVDKEESLKELRKRCLKCKEIIESK